MQQITRPRFNGHVGPVHFVGGQATSDDPHVLAVCEEHPAFTVHPPEDEQQPDGPELTVLPDVIRLDDPQDDDPQEG